jgi:hypothetical protein
MSINIIDKSRVFKLFFYQNTNLVRGLKLYILGKIYLYNIMMIASMLHSCVWYARSSFTLRDSPLVYFPITCLVAYICVL